MCVWINSNENQPDGTFRFTVQDKQNTFVSELTPGLCTKIILQLSQRIDCT
jgi:hypothetical protein